MKKYQQVGAAWQAAWPYELLIRVPPPECWPMPAGGPSFIRAFTEEITASAALLDAWCSTAIGTSGSWQIYTTWDRHVVMLGTQHAEHQLMARLAWDGI